jgi:DHA3 family macrolide efflux protein-like MFS transporter
MGLRPSIILITTGYFMFTLSFAFVTTLISPILQTKVALQVQGRVFATYAFLVMILEPIGHATVGPITDKILEPLMHGNSAITTWLGAIIGTGTGRGMALMFLLMGLLIGILALFGLANPRVRCLEDELPDVIPDAVPVRG